MGEVVGRSRIRVAAMEYWVKESVRRLRTFVASVSWADVGGLSGSLTNVSALKNRWKIDGVLQGCK